MHFSQVFVEYDGPPRPTANEWPRIAEHKCQKSVPIDSPHIRQGIACSKPILHPERQLIKQARMSIKTPIW